MTGWFDWSSWFGNDEDDVEVESGDATEDINALCEQANKYAQELRERYEDGGPDGWAHGSPEHEHSLRSRILKAADTLDRLVDRWEERRYRDPYSQDFRTDRAVFSQRLRVLMDTLRWAEEKCRSLDSQSQQLETVWQAGRLSEQEYCDRRHRIDFQGTRAITRLEMAEIGMTYDDLGDVSDGASHILEDGLSSDGGAARRKIAKKLRSMPRDRALMIIQQAVGDGMISDETARYLIREYVRSP